MGFQLIEFWASAPENFFVYWYIVGFFGIGKMRPLQK